MRNAATYSTTRVVPAEVYLWSGGILLILALWFILLQGQFHLLAAIIIGSTLMALSVTNKPLAISLTFAYLFLMGDIRRLIAVIAPQPQYDPLLLIGPAMAMFLAVPFLFRLTLRDNLSKAMLALLAFMTLEIANPLQGGLAVGLSGAFFYIVPVLWFWIGRSLASPALIERVLYKVVLPLATVAAVLGLCQTFLGFLPFEQAWINSATRVYTSLYIGSSIRAFGFSVNAAEYATLLSFGILIIVAAAFARKRAFIILLPLLGGALLLESSRGFIVKSVFALSIAWIMRKGQKLKPSTIVRMAGLGAGSLIVLSLVASRLTPSSSPPSSHNTSAQEAMSHQLGGLGHPFDSKYSTAGTHASMISASLSRGLTHPLGFGLGYTTFAAEKISGGPSVEGSSEVDLSDMFTALGLIGGAVYLLVAFFVLQGAVRYVRIAPLKVSVPVLAMAFESFGGWLVGGQYSSSALLFLLFGALSYAPNQIPFRRITLDEKPG